MLEDLTDETARQLQQSLTEIIEHVKAAVRDWRAMLSRLDAVMSELQTKVLPVSQADANEALAFLEWLRDDNFTFLGIREYDYTAANSAASLCAPTCRASAFCPTRRCASCAAATSR
jgi:glutamate dehydrogenase